MEKDYKPTYNNNFQDTDDKAFTITKSQEIIADIDNKYNLKLLNV